MKPYRTYKGPAKRIADNSVRRSNGCLIWIGECYSNGYGRMRMADRSSLSVHRAAYAVAYGSIPEGMHVCHKCDVRNCCEPTHLFLGTPTDNMQDMARKGRTNTTKLSPIQVEQLRVLFVAGFKNKDVAPYYPKVDRHTLAAIKSRRTWQKL